MANPAVEVNPAPVPPAEASAHSHSEGTAEDIAQKVPSAPYEGQEGDTSLEDDGEDRQHYPLGQSHTPLTSIPTLGQALLDGNTIDRKYVHSFLQVLADHSQFSDKYQHYEEDEYERKRKRKLRESERKMFFYAGQNMTGLPGEKGSRSSRRSSPSLRSDMAKKRRRKERERERPTEKDERRMGGAAPVLPSSAETMRGFDDPSPSASSHIPPERASAPNVAGSLPPQWHDRSGAPNQGEMRGQRASMPQIPVVQHHAQYTGYGAGVQPLHHSAPSGGYSSSYECMSPLSSYGGCPSSSSSPAPSPHYAQQHHHAQHHQMSLKSTDYVSSPPSYHHPRHPLAQAGHYPHHHPHPRQQHQCSYQHPQMQRQQHLQQQQQHYHHYQPMMASSLPAESLDLPMGSGHYTAEEQPGEVALDEQWMSASSISSASGSFSSASSASDFCAGSESFSSFGPFIDPTMLGVQKMSTENTCADMTAIAATAVESFMMQQQHHEQQQHGLMQQYQGESSPEGQQGLMTEAGGTGLAMEDDDWFNSFFDCSAANSPFLGLNGCAAPSGGAPEQSEAIDSLFADVEAMYGRMVN